MGEPDVQWVKADVDWTSVLLCDFLDCCDLPLMMVVTPAHLASEWKSGEFAKVPAY